jgi:thiamine-phosphate pyrophosphorylase
MTLPDPPILVITDRSQCPESLEDRAEKLFRGGCRWLSLREKDLPASERLSLLRRLIAIGKNFGAQVGVHGDIDAALASGAALHLPAGADLIPVRRLIEGRILLGQSCHDEMEIQIAAAHADYVTLSPVFPSMSKPGYGARLSVDEAARITKSAKIPVLALGGIGVETLPLLADAAIGGIAVMGDAMRATEPERWFLRLAAQWRTICPTSQDAGGLS